MRPKINMCSRCHGFILEDCKPCPQCGIVDNSFCPSCHKYNHRFNIAMKLGLNPKELRSYG